MHSDVVPLVGEVPLDVVPLEDVVHPDKVLQDVVPLEGEVPLDGVPLEVVVLPDVHYQSCRLADFFPSYTKH